MLNQRHFIRYYLLWRQPIARLYFGQVSMGRIQMPGILFMYTDPSNTYWSCASLTGTAPHFGATPGLAGKSLPASHTYLCLSLACLRAASAELAFEITDGSNSPD